MALDASGTVATYEPNGVMNSGAGFAQTQAKTVNKIAIWKTCGARNSLLFKQIGIIEKSTQLSRLIWKKKNKKLEEIHNWTANDRKTWARL